MKKAEELINKHLIKECGGDLGIADGNIYKACLGAVNEALSLSSVSYWVAVTEKLPLVNGFYLVYIDGLTEEIALYRNNEFHVKDETLIDMEITHWMHLPKPPCY